MAPSHSSGAGDDEVVGSWGPIFAFFFFNRPGRVIRVPWQERVCAQLSGLQERPWRSQGDPTTSNDVFKSDLGHAMLSTLGQLVNVGISLDLRVSRNLR